MHDSYRSSLRPCILQPQNRRIGYLFQNYALFPHMTVAENIGAGMQNKPANLRKSHGTAAGNLWTRLQRKKAQKQRQIEEMI